VAKALIASAATGEAVAVVAAAEATATAAGKTRQIRDSRS